MFCFQYIQPPISTWCMGQACSMGSLLLTAGTPGLRHALPHARVMVHQPHGGARVCFLTVCYLPQGRVLKVWIKFATLLPSFQTLKKYYPVKQSHNNNTNNNNLNSKIYRNHNQQWTNQTLVSFVAVISVIPQHFYSLIAAWWLK